LLTTLYSFRMVFVTFFGKMNTNPIYKPGNKIKIPLIILAILSVFAGFVNMPETLANFHPFSNFIDTLLPVNAIIKSPHLEWLFESISAIVVFAGIYLSYGLFVKKRDAAEAFSEGSINKFFENGWDFDKVYGILFVKPVVWLSEIDKKDFFDWINVGITTLALWLNGLLSRTQNGKLRWYLMSLTLGIVSILTYMIYK